MMRGLEIEQIRRQAGHETDAEHRDVLGRRHDRGEMDRRRRRDHRHDGWQRDRRRFVLRWLDDRGLGEQLGGFVAHEVAGEQRQHRRPLRAIATELDRTLPRTTGGGRERHRRGRARHGDRETRCVTRPGRCDRRHRSRQLARDARRDDATIDRTTHRQFDRDCITRVGARGEQHHRRQRSHSHARSFPHQRDPFNRVCSFVSSCFASSWR